MVPVEVDAARMSGREGENWTERRAEEVERA